MQKGCKRTSTPLELNIYCLFELFSFPLHTSFNGTKLTLVIIMLLFSFLFLPLNLTMIYFSEILPNVFEIRF